MVARALCESEARERLGGKRRARRDAGSLQIGRPLGETGGAEGRDRALGVAPLGPRAVTRRARPGSRSLPSAWKAAGATGSRTLRSREAGARAVGRPTGPFLARCKRASSRRNAPEWQLACGAGQLSPSRSLWPGVVPVIAPISASRAAPRASSRRRARRSSSSGSRVLLTAALSRVLRSVWAPCGPSGRGTVRGWRGASN